MAELKSSGLLAWKRKFLDQTSSKLRCGFIHCIQPDLQSQQVQKEEQKEEPKDAKNVQFGKEGNMNQLKVTDKVSTDKAAVTVKAP